jgi:fructokinase
MIVSFGELLVDMIRKGEGYVPFPGGAPANFAVGTSRLGLRVKLVSAVGREPFGPFLIDAMKAEGVDVSAVKKSYKRTTLAFVELRESVPEYFFYRGADTDIWKDDVPKDVFEGAGFFNFGSLSLTDLPVRDTLFHCLAAASKMGVQVSFCPNLREDLWKEELDKHLEKALEYTDIMIASEAELEHMATRETGSMKERVLSLMDRFSLQRLAVTLGSRGAVLGTKDGFFERPAFKVVAVDTTGAGDAFSAGLIAGLSSGMGDRESLRFASATAALTVTEMGAMSALPTRKKVDGFLKGAD